jgi:hypothetical protein
MDKPGLKFSSAVGGDGHLIIEWTEEALAILKATGKRIVCSFPHDGYGGLKPCISEINVMDTEDTRHADC